MASLMVVSGLNNPVRNQIDAPIIAADDIVSLTRGTDRQFGNPISGQIGNDGDCSAELVFGLMTTKLFESPSSESMA